MNVRTATVLELNSEPVVVDDSNGFSGTFDDIQEHCVNPLFEKPRCQDRIFAKQFLSL